MDSVLLQKQAVCEKVGVIMIEKMLEKFEELRMRYFLTIANGGDEKLDCAYVYVGKAIDQCKEIVQEVAKDGGWIPCSERLPQEDEPETVLCEIVNITLKDGTVTVGWCNRYLEKWYVLDWHCDYPVSRKYEDVLAWMPLPSKYEPKDEPYQKGE